MTSQPSAGLPNICSVFIFDTLLPHLLASLRILKHQATSGSGSLLLSTWITCFPPRILCSNVSFLEKPSWPLCLKLQITPSPKHISFPSFVVLHKSKHNMTYYICYYLSCLYSLCPTRIQTLEGKDFSPQPPFFYCIPGTSNSICQRVDSEWMNEWIN